MPGKLITKVFEELMSKPDAMAVLYGHSDSGEQGLLPWAVVCGQI